MQQANCCFYMPPSNNNQVAVVKAAELLGPQASPRWQTGDEMVKLLRRAKAGGSLGLDLLETREKDKDD